MDQTIIVMVAGLLYSRGASGCTSIVFAGRSPQDHVSQVDIFLSLYSPALVPLQSSLEF